MPFNVTNKSKSKSKGLLEIYLFLNTRSMTYNLLNLTTVAIKHWDKFRNASPNLLHTKLWTIN